MDTRYDVPLLVPADREFCLGSSGNAVNDTTICQRISAYNSPFSLNGGTYVAINGGYVQERQSNGTYTSRYIEKPVGDRVVLMKGSDTVASYPGSSNTRVRDAFVGTNISSTSDIVLFNKNPYTEPGSAIDLGRFQVKVSGVMVGSTSSTVSRSISTYFTPSANLATFLSAFKGKITTSAALTTQGGSPLQSNSFNISSVSINDLKVTAETALASYQLNGNPNVYSVKGNLTIENCVNNTFVLSGVKTLVVEGNLTIKCNIGYQSNDTTSSWAFITKNGNIIVDNGDGTVNNKGITNIA